MNTFYDRTEIIAYRRPWSFDGTIEFRLRHVNQTPTKTTIAYATQLTMVERLPKHDGQEVPCLFHLNKTEAQALMDQLWHCGLRPTEGSGSAGSLAATEAHLKDMQKLVFDYIAPIAFGLSTLNSPALNHPSNS